jgi:hypothetical protein
MIIVGVMAPYLITILIAQFLLITKANPVMTEIRRLVNAKGTRPSNLIIAGRWIGDCCFSCIALP